eukprot:TRINITY_DN147_c0_g1_i5.p1 TRINITY_DN147_c0_g1~~TRINITY_DN147_c0_g1_i5.p1  ORF type:complete len:292 (-),score=56.40 TRINITY_DN147_c0_g1_i5:248-1123(-)
MSQPSISRPNSPSKSTLFTKSLIRDVWADNLEEEMANIREVVTRYPCIAMDTEFPGVVARPISPSSSISTYNYQTLRCNVDLLKLIQLGLTFCDEQGNLAPGICTWQFNFKFNLNEDMYAEDSIDLLCRSGIDFRKHAIFGIDVEEFGALLTSSGVVLSESIKWISFHSSYDFAYLLKALISRSMPEEEGEFFELLSIYFPCIYDIKYLMQSCRNLWQGGLNRLAADLEIERIGPEHQAGSDSLLTAVSFYKLQQLFFENKVDDNKYLGVLYGLSVGHAHSSRQLVDQEVL